MAAITPMMPTRFADQWRLNKPQPSNYRVKVAGTVLGLFALIGVAAGVGTVAGLKLPHHAGRIYVAIVGSVAAFAVGGFTLHLIRNKIDYNKYHSEDAVKELCRKLETIELKDLANMKKSISNLFKYHILNENLPEGAVLQGTLEDKIIFDYIHHYHYHSAIFERMGTDSYGHGYEEAKRESDRNIASISQRWATFRDQYLSACLAYRSQQVGLLQV